MTVALSRSVSFFGPGAIVLAVIGCGQTPSAGTSSASARTSAMPQVIDTASRVAALRAAEQRRDPGQVTLDDQSSRDVAVRRAAARALARIASPGARVGLLRALSDEDPTVVAWAAYGLGQGCDAARNDTVNLLAARALGAPPGLPNEPEPLREIARAIGHCAADKSEPTLFAWLSGAPEQVRAACLGLGDLAGERKRLREETIASLLNLAAGTASSPSIPEAFFPLARVDNVPPSVTSRLVEVIDARVKDPSDYRLFAIRALARAKQPAIPTLARVLDDVPGFSGEERVEAVRMLARIGDEGLGAIIERVAKLDIDPKSIAAGGAPFDVGLTMLTSLATLKDAKLMASAAPALVKIATLDPAAAATNSGKRRISLMRCGAARVIAKGNVAAPSLVSCDLSDGSIGARTLAAVAGDDDIIGERLAAYTKLIASKDARTREAAITLIATHPEIAEASARLTEALSADEVGVVESAADVISKAPDRASPTAAVRKPVKEKPQNDKPKRDGKDTAKPDDSHLEPSKPLVAALEAAMARGDKAQDPELQSSVIDALGAIQDKASVPHLEELCRSTYPTLREHASGALALITGAKHPCPSPASAGPDPPELANPARSVTLVLSTDAGELRIALDASIAPIAVARIADLARTGYYSGNVIHRVDPSFVVQFGSPHADGAGGPDGRLPLRCETSPLPFDRLSVGLALAGRDTGSSQLFVMRSRMPHLDGLYPLLGTASGPWNLVSEGDVIDSVRVEDASEPPR